MSYVTDRHLGGYVEGGDDATHYPDFWRWLVEEQDVRSVIDVGCGEGHALRFFRELGCAVLGVEGIPQDDIDIIEHDYTVGVWNGWAQPIVSKSFDLCWCCEFVEHVEEQYVPNFLETFKLAPLVLMSHAEPGQDGYHHVNLRPRDYWIGALAAIGYALDEELTLHTRSLAALNTNPWNHYKRSGLAFRRANP